VAGCRCNDFTELQGRDAEEYVDSHLRLESTDDEKLVERYVCSDTGMRWTLDWPGRTEREPGQARLLAESR
jgi:hypothetical protein